MDRRKFLTLTGTFTGGLLVLPDFLYSYSMQPGLVTGGECVVFLQLNGGNDGLNTFIPYLDDRYYDARRNIAIPKNEVIVSQNGMGFHPTLKGLSQIQQNGHLAVLQNVGYPHPVRSHFRSREIWQTGSGSDEYINEGWLGRYLDVQCKDHHNPIGAINIDSIDNLALRGFDPNSMTIRDPKVFQSRNVASDDTISLSGNPQLDFVRRLAGSVSEGADDVQKAIANAPQPDASYPKNPFGKNLEWIAKLIKGKLNSRVYYTSIGGFDTHDTQIPLHRNALKMVDDGVFSFYQDMKSAGLLSQITLVIFSEFGRRVHDNGRGTDHGTAAPMFVIGGNNSGKIIGNNPDLADLDNGDLKHSIDFRSVYSAILKQKLQFDASKIGIDNASVKGLFE
ncbi:DUF1501 domain-containing protein [Flavobacterium silvaticum]|uniref:DUF1501 domain-containing protein n=1 Tax=Flavobacterium silvaticum TaxID=1852020 RepID=A0A972FXH0_9FLAO|nr:DUF1501 domain-containing protein [Flavobacterium silvaticum]NMH29435.1 DUF1501 domain-containing protein [Flavobacterium silvaticum]